VGEEKLKKEKVKPIKAQIPKIPETPKPKKVKPVAPKKELTPKEKFEQREALIKRLKEKGVSEEEKQKQLNALRKKQGLEPVEVVKPKPKEKLAATKKEIAYIEGMGFSIEGTPEQLKQRADFIKETIKQEIPFLTQGKLIRELIEKQKAGENVEAFIKSALKPKEPVKEKGVVLSEKQIKKGYVLLSDPTTVELKKTFKENKAILPDELERYTGSFGINKVLREKGVSALSKEDKKMMKALDKILNKKELKREVQLNRGVSFTNQASFDKFFKERKVGTIIENKAFTSTTIDEDAVDKFLDAEPFSVKLEILADKKTKGVYIPNFKGGEEGEKWEGSFEDIINEEKEFLLPRKMKFQILSREKVSSKSAKIIMKAVEDKIEKPKPVKAPIKKSEAEPLLTKTQIKKEFKNLEKKSEKALEKIFKEKETVLPEAVLDYVQAFEINPALRTDTTEKLSKKHKKAIKDLDKILDKKELKEGVQLNRGLTFKTQDAFNNFIKPLKTGTIQEDKAYVSTTIGDIPEQFLEKKTEPFSVKIKILADKNTKGAYIPNFKDGGIEENEEAFIDFIDDEKEFLLPRGTKMQIVEVPKIKGKKATVIMRIINA
jgi:hypothetical protein